MGPSKQTHDMYHTYKPSHIQNEIISNKLYHNTSYASSYADLRRDYEIRKRTVGIALQNPSHTTHKGNPTKLRIVQNVPTQ